jgi:adenine C2-methylase RlmN of 23S rRNA A2503 and tRNA A37
MESLKEIGEGRVNKVRLLSSIDRMDRELRDRFIHLRNELSNRNIVTEMRVIVDSQTKSSIHDRWLMGDNVILNIPSADVVSRGQYSEIKETVNRPLYDAWWTESLDVVSDWSKIDEILKSK